MLKGPRHEGVVYSSALSGLDLPTTMRQRLRWLPNALMLLAFGVMVVALARPRVGREQTLVSTEGIAIELVVDRSGSMMALDFKINGDHVNRLEALKNVASKFVLGEQEGDPEKPLGGRFSDLIGLVVFAGYADSVTPLTLDHSYLVSQLNQTQIVNERSEDGTAIGDAISLAVEKLSTLQDRPDQQAVESKIIILLTDGENTAGEIEPVQAAELAKAMGVKIYTIGISRRLGTGRNTSGEVDEALMTAIATSTGGRYFRARTPAELQEVYAILDQLEPVEQATSTFRPVQALSWLPLLAAFVLSLLLLFFRASSRLWSTSFAGVGSEAS